MTRGTDVLDFYYDAGGTPVALKYDDTIYYYLTTLQGDVLLILDEDGEIVVSYDYDAWGKILAIGGSMATTLGTLNPLTYRGYVYDHETGLYYLQSRYYNPEWGRFLNADALVSTGGLLGNNMFAYCGNNPMMCIDPSGHVLVTISVSDDPTKEIFPSIGGGAAGARMVASGYTLIAGMKYSNDKDVRDLYESVIAFIAAKTTKERIQAYKDIQDNNIISGVSPVITIKDSVNQIEIGILLLLAPVPTVADDLKGVF